MYYRPHKCGQIIGCATGDYISVDDYFLIHPAGSGMNQVIFDGGD
jgi:hypothetical protein